MSIPRQYQTLSSMNKPGLEYHDPFHLVCDSPPLWHIAPKESKHFSENLKKSTHSSQYFLNVYELTFITISRNHYLLQNITWNILGISLESALYTSPCVTGLTWNRLLQLKTMATGRNFFNVLHVSNYCNLYSQVFYQLKYFNI